MGEGGGGLGQQEVLIVGYEIKLRGEEWNSSTQVIIIHLHNFVWCSWMNEGYTLSETLVGYLPRKKFN